MSLAGGVSYRAMVWSSKLAWSGGHVANVELVVKLFLEFAAIANSHVGSQTIDPPFLGAR